MIPCCVTDKIYTTVEKWVLYAEYCSRNNKNPEIIIDNDNYTLD